jgi:hypothetical protein
VTQPLVSLTADTNGSTGTTAVAIRSGTCNGTTDLSCGTNNSGMNDSTASITTVAVGEYFVIVDDVSTGGPQNYELHVTGTLPPAATSAPASTSFICTTGYACNGPWRRTCAAACNDTSDADGDGDLAT